MTILLVLILAPLIVLTLCFAVELCVGLRPLRQASPAPTVQGRAVIIVPAHDEEAVIGATIERLKAAAEGVARILVVADNCADSTARIARHLGVEVVERSDQVRRGKGFALDFAKQALQADPPEVVLVIDADCSTDQRSIAHLIAACLASGNPCQATNIQIPSDSSSPAVKLSTFAFFIKNVIRQRALQRLAGRVHLLGTGMAFPWSIFASADLATGDIVEDLKLGLDLSRGGHPPIFAEGATVWSRAESEANTLSQRRRWEGGFLRNALRSGPSMLARSLGKGDLRTFWAAVNLMIPPFALLLSLDLCGLALAIALAWLGAVAWWPAWLVAAAILFASLGLALGWVAGGSRFAGLGDIARAPVYLAWKLPVYLGFARHGAPKDWKRTDRSAA